MTKIISIINFMSFIITYSPHSPYTYNKIECQTNFVSDIKTIYPIRQKVKSYYMHIVLLEKLYRQV